MFSHHQDRPRTARVAVALVALFGLVALLGVVGSGAIRALSALPWRTVLRDDVALTVTRECSGASAEQVERSLLIPLERLLSTLGAQQLSGSAIAGRVTLTAHIPSNFDEAVVRARVLRTGRCTSASAPPPELSLVRASRGVAMDVMRVLFALALALSVPALVTPLVRSPARSELVGRRSSFRRCVGRVVDETLDRFQDALAWALRHRGRLAAALLVLASAATLVALGKGVATRDSLAPRSTTSDWHVVVFGEDLRTLAGVKRRIADELRRLPAVRRVVVNAAVDDIRHIDGHRAASVEVTADRAVTALGAEIQQAIDATVVPVGHRVAIVGEVVEAQRLRVAVGTVAIAGAIALVVVAALRHGNWAAPLAIGVGIPIVLLGTAPALLIGREQLVPWVWLGTSLPVLMHARQAGALFAVAEARHRGGSPLHVALIDSARLALRPLLLLSLLQAIVLAPFAALGDANITAAAFAAIGGLGMSVVAVAFAGPVAYEVAHLAISRWRVSRLRRRLGRRAGP